MMQSLKIALLLAAVVLSGCEIAADAEARQYSHFTALTDFSKFNRTQNANGEIVLLSPEIKSPLEWNQLALSWNATVSLIRRTHNCQPTDSNIGKINA